MKVGLIVLLGLVVNWTGLGNNGQTVGHGLNTAPELIITKVLNINGEGWYTYSAETGNTKFLALNTNNPAYTAAEVGYGGGTNFWNDTSPTSSVFSLGSIAEIKSYNHIAYCFHSVLGYQKIGSYTGNGSSTGPTETTDFQPRFLMIKAIDRGGNWVIIDSVRDTSNPRYHYLEPNTTTQEQGNNLQDWPRVEFNTNGFQLKGTDGIVNENNKNYIYLAIA